MKKSITPKNSSLSSASRVKLASGKDTSGLKQIESNPLISPAVNRLHDFDCGVSGLRNLVRLDAPDFGHMFSRFRIRYGALAGQLIALLSVFASALAIALAGDHGAARAFPADVAGRQAYVDQRKNVFHTLRLMLDAARMKRESALAGGEPVRGLFDGFRRDA